MKIRLLAVIALLGVLAFDTAIFCSGSNFGSGSKRSREGNGEESDDKKEPRIEPSVVNAVVEQQEMCPVCLDLFLPADLKVLHHTATKIAHSACQDCLENILTHARTPQQPIICCVCREGNITHPQLLAHNVAYYINKALLGNSYDVASQMALIAIQNTHSYVRAAGVALFQLLCVRGYTPAVRIAIESVQKALAGDDAGIRDTGVELLHMLVDRQYVEAYDIAVAEAQKAIARNDYTSGFNLVRPLIGIGYNLALEAVTATLQAAIVSDSPDVRSEGFQLLQRVAQRYGCDVVCDALIAAAQSDYVMPPSGFDILERLLQNNYRQVYGPAIVAAQKAIAAEVLDLQEEGVSILFSLINQNHVPSYGAAAAAAQRLVESENPDLCSRALSLLQVLVDRKKYEDSYPITMAAAESAIHRHSDNLKVQNKALELLTSLATEGYEPAYPVAVLVAQGLGHNPDLHEEMLRMLGALTVYRKYKDAYPITMTVAQNAVRSDNPEIQHRALNLLRALVSQQCEDSYQTAIAAAQHALHSNNPTTQKDAFRLLQCLINYDCKLAYPVAVAAIQALDGNPDFLKDRLSMLSDLVAYKKYKDSYPIAMDTAQRAMHSDDVEVQQDALRLLNSLVKERFELAYSVADAAIQALGNKPVLYRQSLSVLEALVYQRHENSYPIAMAAAQRAMHNDYLEARWEALQLLKSLVHQGFEPAYEAAVKAVQVLGDRADLSAERLELLRLLMIRKYAGAYDVAATQAAKADISWVVLGIFNDLVFNDYQLAYDPAMTAAQRAVNHADQHTRSLGVRIFDRLVSKNYDPAYEAAAAVVSQDMNNEDEYRRGLLRSLVQHKHQSAYPIAMSYVQKAILSSSSDLVAESCRMLKALLDNGYEPAYAEAANIAREAIKNDEPSVNREGLSILNSLIKKDYQSAYDFITEAAKEAVESSDTGVKHAGMNLLQGLVYKKHRPAYDLALKTAQDSADVTERAELLYLLVLGQYDQALPLATAEVEKMIYPHNSIRRRLGSAWMSHALVVVNNYEPAYDLAAQAAQSVIKEPVVSDDTDRIGQAREKSLEIIRYLCNRNYEPAYEAAIAVIQDSNSDQTEKQQLKEMLQAKGVTMPESEKAK